MNTIYQYFKRRVTSGSHNQYGSQRCFSKQNISHSFFLLNCRQGHHHEAHHEHEIHHEHEHDPDHGLQRKRETHKDDKKYCPLEYKRNKCRARRNQGRDSIGNNCLECLPQPRVRGSRTKLRTQIRKCVSCISGMLRHFAVYSARISCQNFF